MDSATLAGVLSDVQAAGVAEPEHAAAVLAHLIEQSQEGDGPLLERVEAAAAADAEYAAIVEAARTSIERYHLDAADLLDNLPSLREEAVALAAADAAGEDVAAWHGFVAESAAAWDGTEEHWPAFREWFLDAARYASVAGYAEAFIQEAESGDKTAVFAAYGVQIVPSAEDTSGADLAAEIAAASDEDLQVVVAAVVADCSDDGTPAADEADLAAEIAAVGDDDLAALVTEIAAEFGEYPDALQGEPGLAAEIAAASDEELEDLVASVVGTR